MSGEKEEIIRLVQQDPILGRYATENLAEDLNILGTPESWKRRLPQMVASAIPSEVIDLIEALQTTPLALSEDTAKDYLIQTYENGAENSLNRAMRLEEEGNSLLAQQARQASAKDALQAQVFKTGGKTVVQAIAERKEERKQIFPYEPTKQENHFLHLHTLRQKIRDS